MGYITRRPWKLSRKLVVHQLGRDLRGLRDPRSHRERGVHRPSRVLSTPRVSRQPSSGTLRASCATGPDLAEVHSRVPGGQRQALRGEGPRSLSGQHAGAAWWRYPPRLPEATAGARGLALFRGWVPPRRTRFPRNDSRRKCFLPGWSSCAGRSATTHLRSLSLTARRMAALQGHVRSWSSVGAPSPSASEELGEVRGGRRPSARHPGAEHRRSPGGQAVAPAWRVHQGTKGWGRGRTDDSQLVGQRSSVRLGRGAAGAS